MFLNSTILMQFVTVETIDLTILITINIGFAKALINYCR